MRVILLSDVNSAHTQKWAVQLSRHQIEVGIFSFSYPKNDWYKNYSNIHLLYSANLSNANSIFTKLNYITHLKALKKIISTFRPDVLHAHYASSYGLLGALSKFHPFVISVWGSDVFDFPQQNIFNKMILKYNLKCADKITSTSHIMAKQTNRFTNKEIKVIPFGIDLNIFQPIHTKKIFKNNEIVIGTIKTLSYTYGIDTLIKAFSILKNKLPQLNLKLLIVGDGDEKEKLQSLANKLNIKKDTIFYGQIPHQKVVELLAEIDIFVALSREESFGVAIVEAMACEKPVVAGNASGFKEIIEDKKTGLIVEKENPSQAADAIQFLIENPEFAKQLTINAKQKVFNDYNIEDNVKEMIEVYKSLL